MPVLRELMAEDVLRGYRFYCPGCKDYHGVSTNLDLRGPHWRFDGNLERPTFSPSVRVRGGWVYHDDGDATFDPSFFCHFFVQHGRIEYLSDCTHALATSVVDMVDLDTLGPDK